MTQTLQPMREPPCKVLYVNHSSKIAGAEQCLLRLMRSLDRSRYEPFLVCPDGELVIEAHRRDVPVFHLSFLDYQSNRSTIAGITIPNPFLALWNMVKVTVMGWKIGEIARRESIDIIHANSLLTRLPACIAGKIAGVAVVWHVRDILSSKYWLAVYDFMSARLVARLITVSNACHIQFSNLSNVITVYDGIDSEAFKWDEQAALKVRKSFGWDEQHTVFGIFGRISKTKGHDHFVRAAIIVHERYRMTRWLVVGEAWNPEEQRFLSDLRIQASEAGLEQDLIFTGFRSDVNEVMSACDVVVVPSVIQDSFPNTVLEGMACSRAILAFPVGGIPEAIDDGITGLLVKRMDGEGLAEAEMLLVDDPMLRQRLGREARKRVVACFNMQQTQEGIERVYQEIIDASRHQERY